MKTSTSARILKSVAEVQSHQQIRRDPEMNAVIRRAVIVAIVGGLLLAPALVIAGQSMWSTIHIGEVFVGATLATAFLAITGIVTLIYREKPNLRGAVMTSYVAKTSVILAALLLLPANNADRISMAIAMVVAAVTYLALQTILVVKGEAALRANRPEPHYKEWVDNDSEDDSDKLI